MKHSRPFSDFIGATAFLTFLFWPATQALAFESCAPREPGPVNQIILNTRNTGCDIAQDIASVLKRVSLKLGRTASTPLTLVVGPQSDNASFDDGHIIEIPSQFVHYSHFGETTIGHLGQLDVIVIHEYGHSLLKKILKNEFNQEFGNTFSKLERLSEDREQELLSTDKIDGAPTKDESLGEDYKLYDSIVSPYNELYADTISVYFEQDPSAVVNALYFNEMTDAEYKFVKLRDFSQTIQSEATRLMSDEHTRLSFVRSFIGQKMMPQNAAQARRFLNVLERSIIRSIHVDLERKSTLETKPANDQLIEIIKAELRSTSH